MLAPTHHASPLPAALACRCALARDAGGEGVLHDELVLSVLRTLQLDPGEDEARSLRPDPRRGGWATGHASLHRPRRRTNSVGASFSFSTKLVRWPALGLLFCCLRYESVKLTDLKGLIVARFLHELLIRLGLCMFMLRVAGIRYLPKLITHRYLEEFV